MDEFTVNLLGGADRDVYEAFKARFKPIIKTYKGGFDLERPDWTPIPLDGVSLPRPAGELAEIMEAGVLLGRQMEKEIQYLIGELLFFMTLGDFFRLLPGEPRSLSDWYNLKRVSGDEPAHSEPTYGKYRRVYAKWFFEYGDDPAIRDLLMQARNTDVLDAYGRLVAPGNALAWAQDATTESNKSYAMEKANAALTISARDKLPLSNITPQMAIDEIEAQSVGKPGAPSFTAVSTRELPRFIFPDAWADDEQVELKIERETRNEVLLRLRRISK